MQAPNYVTPELLPHYRKAGRIAALALQYGAKLIVPGARVVEVLDKVEAFIAQQGAQPAFPAQISLNEVAAHFCPEADDQTRFSEKDVAKLDVGVHVNGYVGDNALSVDLTPNGEHAELIKASREARDAAIKLVRPGVTPHELGSAVHEVITGYGLSPIRNLSGHGVGLFRIHTPPSIPNYPNNDHSQLAADHVIAIEPFATNGEGAIYNASAPTLFSQVREGRVRSPAAREVLRFIQQYQGLPFTTRWLTKALGTGKVRLGLRELRRLSIIHEYPPLPEKGRGLVSQSEHTILIKEKPEILTKPD